MAYKLILLRHGQSDWNMKNLFTGWVDVPLTEQGREEAGYSVHFFAAPRDYDGEFGVGCGGSALDSG